MKENKTAEYKKYFFITLIVSTVLVFAYLTFLCVFINNSTTSINEFVKKLLLDIFIIFIFSLLLGFSFKLFSLKISGAAKRTLHVLALYAVTEGAVFLLANSGDDARSRILFAFISTMLYIIIYFLSVLISYFTRKYLLKIR